MVFCAVIDFSEMAFQESPAMLAKKFRQFVHRRRHRVVTESEIISGWDQYEVTGEQWTHCPYTTLVNVPMTEISAKFAVAGQTA